MFFPWVGLLIGGVVAAIGFGLDHILPSLPASALVVILLVAASRGLHMDGLADTADGFFSSRSRERMLEIMRDSRAGSMGILAIAAVLILKVSLLTPVDTPDRWRVILLMPLFGRCALLIVMALFRYARETGGLASIFQRALRRGPAVLLVMWPLVMIFAAGWLVASLEGLVAAGAAVVVTLLFALYSRHKIGGYTGDTLGAACEIVELVPPLVALLCM